VGTDPRVAWLSDQEPTDATEPQAQWDNGARDVPLEHALVRDLTVHVLEYEQQIEDQKPSRWAWITNLEMTWHNGLTLAQAGRCRWTIENEGFNTQKHGAMGWNMSGVTTSRHRNTFIC